MASRKQIQAKIYEYMDMLDPTGSNSNIYKTLFKPMSDKDFKEWYSRLGKDYKLSFTAPNMGKVKVKLSMLEKVLNRMGLNLEEQLIIEESGIKTLTPMAHTILSLSVRRASQFAVSKINLPKNNNTRNAITGQVTNKSKAGGISMPEALILTSRGLDNTMKELTSVRAGDTEAMRQLEAVAMDEGKVSLAKLKPYMTKTRGLKSMIQFFRAMHLDLQTK